MSLFSVFMPSADKRKSKRFNDPAVPPLRPLDIPTKRADSGFELVSSRQESTPKKEDSERKAKRWSISGLKTLLTGPPKAKDEKSNRESSHNDQATIPTSSESSRTVQGEDLRRSSSGSKAKSPHQRKSDDEQLRESLKNGIPSQQAAKSDVAEVSVIPDPRQSSSSSRREHHKDKKNRNHNDKEKEQREKKRKRRSMIEAPAGDLARAGPLTASVSLPVASTQSILGADVLMCSVHRDYTLGKTLGQGAFSVVHEATSNSTNEKVAIKITRKNAIDVRLLRREIENLKSLDHTNIVKLYDVYEDSQNFYLVMELVEGKELFDRVVEKGNYTEKEAKNVVHQLVSAIWYLHERKIAHRDLKPDNIISVKTSKGEIIKVADFGLSKNFNQEKMVTSCGSLNYAAPEVLEGQPYDKLVDMWSIGVIIYILLVGYFPFWGDTDAVLYRKIVTIDYKFGEGWDNISKEAKDLIANLLVRDPKKRLNAAQVLAHPWFDKSSSSP